MDERVNVVVPVAPEIAAALTPRDLAEFGRMLSEIMGKNREVTPLSEAIAALKADVRAAGLTDEEIDAEFAAHKVERRHSNQRG